MAITTINIGSPTNISVYKDTAMGATADGVKASAATLFQIIIDNSANAGSASYVKLWNLASGSVTVGTTAPDECIYVPPAALITMPYYTGAVQGKSFGTALTAACVTTAGTAGNTPPSGSVIVTIAFV